MKTFEEIKDTLFVLAMNEEKARKYEVKKHCSDIALVIASTTGEIINTEHLINWHKTFTEVFSIAKDNGAKLFDVQHFTDADLLTGTEGKNIFTTQQLRLDGMMGAFISNSIYRYGASAFFWTGVRERLYKLVGGNYYIAFTSEHEFVIHKDSGDPDLADDIRKSVECVNDEVNSADEVLTKRIFYYSDTQGVGEVRRDS